VPDWRRDRIFNIQYGRRGLQLAPPPVAGRNTDFASTKSNRRKPMGKKNTQAC
jgi:hypothetical protein